MTETVTVTVTVTVTRKVTTVSLSLFAVILFAQHAFDNPLLYYDSQFHTLVHKYTVTVTVTVTSIKHTSILWGQ